MENWKDNSEAIIDIKKRISDSNEIFYKVQKQILDYLMEIMKLMTIIVPIEYQYNKHRIFRHIFKILSIKMDYESKYLNQSTNDIESIKYMDELMDQLEFSESKIKLFNEKIIDDIYIIIEQIGIMESLLNSDVYKYMCVGYLTNIIKLLNKHTNNHHT